MVSIHVVFESICIDGQKFAQLASKAADRDQVGEIFNALKRNIYKKYRLKVIRQKNTSFYFIKFEAI